MKKAKQGVFVRCDCNSLVRFNKTRECRCSNCQCGEYDPIRLCKDCVKYERVYLQGP